MELKQQTSNAGIYRILYKLWERLPLENPNFCVTVLAILDVVASLYRYTSSTLCQSTWLRLSFRLWIAAAKRNNIEFRRGKKPLQTQKEREREGWFTHRLKSRALLPLNSCYFLPWEIFTAGYAAVLETTCKDVSHHSPPTLIPGWEISKIFP